MSIFNYLDYKQYLIDSIKNRPQNGYGEVSRISEFLNVNSTLISQVLADRRDFSLEQSIRITKYLNLNSIESRYFMQLVHFARAGTEELKNFHQNEINQIRQASQNLSSRVAADLELTDAEKSFVVSSWRPTAILVATGRKDGITMQELAIELDVSLEEIAPILDRLTQIGIVGLSEGKYSTGFKRLFLPKKSDFLNRHQMNWRLRAIHRIDIANPEDVTYTSVASIAKSDWPAIKEKILTFIGDYAKSIAESGSEDVVCLNLDFFKVSGKK